jgi:hypothetical protein
MSSGTLFDEKVEEKISTTDDGDHERFAHYFAKKDLDKAFFDGAKITALCGKQDTPTRDFTKYPVCPECKETFEKMKE